MNSIISSLLTGSYDLHVHANPDINERRMDVLETARAAYEAEMGGIALKSIEYPTGPIAYILNEMYPGLNVIGSISLERAIGGINPNAVEVAAQLGTKIVWMPSSIKSEYPDKKGNLNQSSIFDNSGLITNETTEILEIISDRDLILNSGSLSPQQTLLLFEKASDIGVKRMIASNNSNKESIEEQNKLISLGSYLEYTFLPCMPSVNSVSPTELKEKIRRVGANHCILTTNFGQPFNPPPPEGMRMAIGHLLAAELSEKDIEMLVKTNPIGLLT